MRRSLIILLLLFIISQNFCSAQFRKQIDSLSAVCNKITSDSERVIMLGKLADLYYTFKLNKQGDSVLKQQLLIADLANNNNLILAAFFGDAITNISPSATKEEFDNTIQFLEKGITYAKSQNKYDYITLGHIRMAGLLRKRGDNDKALSNVNLAIQQFSHIESDSLKAIIYIELGNTYQARNESVLASNSYNIAYDIAFKAKSVPLQSEIYHCFSEMYKQLGHEDIAKEELKKSLALNKEHNYQKGILQDYYDLARLTDERFFIDKTIELATTLKLSKYVLKGKELMFYYLMVIEKNSTKTLSYLESEPDVKQLILNTGIAYYFRTVGQVYLWADKPDSALHYFKIVEADYQKAFNTRSSNYLLAEIAECYMRLNDIPNAINYYTRVLQMGLQIGNAQSITTASTALSELFEKQGDFKQALIYSKQAKQYKDSLNKLAEGRDIALLNVERENRKHAEEVRREEQRITTKRNIQYMAITIAIGVVFIILLIIGMFPVSKLTIKILGYIFFISVFEFIVLVIDNFLHKITHGEPLKIWLIKIVLIAILVPFQHYLEHGLIKFLESRKLLEARTKLNLKKWLHKAKKPVPVKTPDFEEGTAVL